MFPSLRADIQRNIQDYCPRSLLHRLALILTLNSVHAVVLIRFQFWCAKMKLPTLFAAKLLFYLFKIEISKRATIGPGLRLPHPMGIIIAPNVSLGANCDLYADVRIVLAHYSKQGATIGDHVFIGDGAKVVGHIDVGNDAIIGVASVVTKNVPPGTTVAGIPAKIVSEANQRMMEAA